ncbi:MAG: phytase [Actinomycetota bacterium]
MVTSKRRSLGVVAIVAMTIATTTALLMPVRAATLGIAQDAHVSAAVPDDNLDGSPSLLLGATPPEIAYLKFEVASFEAGGAVLQVYASEPHSGFEVRTVASNDWSADTITWNNAPGISSEPVAAAQAATDEGWAELDLSSIVTGPGTYSVALVTSTSEELAVSSTEGPFAPRVMLGADVPAPAPSETPLPAPTESPLPSESPLPAPTESPAPPPEPGSARVTWTVETEGVNGEGDVADDPAIWVNPADAALSLIIATNKDASSGGMHVYGLDGGQRQYLPSGRMNNVDLRYGFELDGVGIDLASATNRTANTIDFFSVTAEGGLEQVGSVESGIAVYGSCMYRSPSGRLYAFATSEQGEVEQFEITADGSSVSGTKVRSFDVGASTEGCAADDGTGALYLSEEQVGLWRYGAEPGDGAARTQVDAVGSDHLSADVEGVTIYLGAAGAGYVIVSSQGDNTFPVYDRASNAYLGSFEIDGADGDAVTQTDGIDVTSAAVGPAYPQGLLVVHDATDEGATSNFKLVSWDQIVAALDLGAVGVAPPPPVDPVLPAEPVDPALPEPEEATVSTKVLGAGTS